MVGSRQPVVDGEMLLYHRRPKRDCCDRSDDWITAVVREPGRHSKPPAEPGDHRQIQTVGRGGIARSALQKSDISRARRPTSRQTEVDVVLSCGPG